MGSNGSGRSRHTESLAPPLSRFPRVGRWRLGKTFPAQLGDGRVGLRRRHAERAQDVLGLCELDLAVLDDLDAVAGRFAKIEPVTWEDFDAVVGERAARRLLVV